jgi:hypothetical protein
LAAAPAGPMDRHIQNGNTTGNWPQDETNLTRQPVAQSPDSSRTLLVIDDDGKDRNVHIIERIANEPQKNSQ